MIENQNVADVRIFYLKKVSGHIPEPSDDYFNIKSLIKIYNLNFINPRKNIKLKYIAFLIPAISAQLMDYSGVIDLDILMEIISLR